MSDQPTENVSTEQPEIESSGTNYRQQMERIQERKERSKNIIDDVWSSVQPEPASNSAKEEIPNGQADNGHDDSERVEEAQRTFDDVIDEAWESGRGEQQAEADGEGELVDSENDSEAPEGEDPVEDLEVSDERDDIILATVAGEDGEETQVEIPKNAMITVKVDGEEQQVSIQDYANGISGQKAIAQKFTALNGERKAFESQVQSFNEASTKAVELMQENKAVEAIQHVAEMMGQNPHLLFTTLFEEITPVLNDYAALSEQERTAWVQDIKNKKAEFQAKSAQDELQRLQTAQEQQAKVQNVQETYGLDEATFTHAYHALEAEMAAGTLQKQAITPELVGEYSKLVTIEGYAANALVGTDYEGDQVAINQVLQAVNQLARSGEQITEQLVNDMVSQALGRQQQVEKSKVLNKKLTKKGVQPKAKNEATPKQVQRANPQDQPSHWMERALDELDNGGSAVDLGLMSSKPHNKRTRK